jgi:hypothetical protein
MIDEEEWIRKEVVVVIIGICLEDLRKTMNNHSQDSRCSG